MNDQAEFTMTLDRALNGDVLSMYRVAECYLEGIGAPINTMQAIRWYKQAANKRNIDSMFELARFYCIGIGVVQDISAAQFWFTKAYDSGHLTKTGSAAQTNRRAEVSRLLMNLEPPA